MDKKIVFKATELIPREDRRDSYEELKQKEVTYNIFNEICSEYEAISVNYDYINSVSRGNKSQYLREDGTIATDNKKRNHFYDTKSFDALVIVENKYTKDYLKFYYFCKSTKQEGGYQHDAVQELGVMLNCIEKNKDDDMVVMCMLEGPFWKPSLIKEGRFDNKKSFYVTRENMKETLIDILKTRGLLTKEQTVASETNSEEILEAMK